MPNGRLALAEIKQDAMQQNQHLWRKTSTHPQYWRICDDIIPVNYLFTVCQPSQSLNWMLFIKSARVKGPKAIGQTNIFWNNKGVPSANYHLVLHHRPSPHHVYSPRTSTARPRGVRPSLSVSPKTCRGEVLGSPGCWAIECWGFEINGAYWAYPAWAESSFTLRIYFLPFHPAMKFAQT